MMKKLLFPLLFSTPLFALYNGNPAEPELIDEGLFFGQENWIVIKTGYLGDYVWDRKLKARGVAKGGVETFTLYDNQGVLTFNVRDRFEVFGSMGGMRAHFNQRPNIDHRKRRYETNTDLVWGAGARGIIIPIRPIDLGVEANYEQSHLSLRNAGSHAQLKYHEWQVGIGLSVQAGWFVPYIAGKYSKVLGKMEHIHGRGLPFSRFTLENRQHFGLALGASVGNIDIIDFTLEARVFDETAFSAALNIKL